MAEAHAAVAFSFAVSHEGVHFNVNHDVLKAVWESGVRDWKKKLIHAKVITPNTNSKLVFDIGLVLDVLCLPASIYLVIYIIQIF